MKYFFRYVVGSLLVFSLFLTGCSDDNSSASPTAATLSSGTASIEGQLVADAGIQAAKLSAPELQHAEDESETVYPVSGITVELVQDGTVIATTTTDEYGRFQFTNLEPGDYDIRVVSGDGSVAHYHVYVNADQSITIYGMVMPDGWRWEHEPGSHWDEMPYGSYWGSGFCGASPGPGYWHDGQEWHGPGTGYHHGPHH